VARRRNRGERIEHVVRADQIPLDAALFLALEQHTEAAAIRYQQFGLPADSSPKVSCGVQQPIFKVSANSGSAPFTTSRPLPGTLRTR